MMARNRLSGNQINWNQVYLFSEVAAAGSIKDVASKLDLSPSTLSQHIAQLEKDLQIQLFYRQHRKLTLTPEGSRLYQRAKEMFEAGQRLIDVVSPVELGSYPVSIGLIPSPSLQLAYGFINRFVKAHGPLSMKLYHSGYAELEQGLSKSEFDFGFADRIPERKDLNHHVVSDSFLRFYVSSKIKKEKKTFAELIAEMPLLIAKSEPHTQSLAEQVLLDAGIVPHSVITSNYPGALRELCETGLGVGVFSEAWIETLDPGILSPLKMPAGTPDLRDLLYVWWNREAENTEAVKKLKSILPAKA